jgi:hypothetical protein
MSRPADLYKAAIVAAATVLAFSGAQAQDKPSGTISFSGGNVAFIAGVNWGGGTLRFNGMEYPLEVKGLSVGAIGANKFSASGEVFNLKQASDIEGTYAAGTGSVTVGGGVGGLQMKNDKGVVIKASSTSAGAALKLGPSGMTIKLKK